LVEEVMLLQLALREAQANQAKVEATLATTERALNRSVTAERKHRRALHDALDSQRNALAKLAAMEDEMSALKREHDQLRAAARFTIREGIGKQLLKLEQAAATRGLDPIAVLETIMSKIPPTTSGIA